MGYYISTYISKTLTLNVIIIFYILYQFQESSFEKVH